MSCLSKSDNLGWIQKLTNVNLQVDAQPRQYWLTESHDEEKIVDVSSRIVTRDAISFCDYVTFSIPLRKSCDAVSTFPEKKR